MFEIPLNQSNDLQSWVARILIALTLWFGLRAILALVFDGLRFLWRRIVKTIKNRVIPRGWQPSPSWKRPGKRWGAK